MVQRPDLEIAQNHDDLRLLIRYVVTRSRITAVQRLAIQNHINGGSDQQLAKALRVTRQAVRHNRQAGLNRLRIGFGQLGITSMSQVAF